MDCISLSLGAEYIGVHDLEGQKTSPTDLVGYRYNPNLSNIEISLIYSDNSYDKEQRLVVEDYARMLLL